MGALLVFENDVQVFIAYVHRMHSNRTGKSEGDHDRFDGPVEVDPTETIAVGIG